MKKHSGTWDPGLRTVAAFAVAALIVTQAMAMASARIEPKKAKGARHAEVIDFEEADDRLGGELSDRFEEDYESVLFVSGRLELEGDFLEAIAALNDQEVDLVVIDGDLDVGGRIALYESAPGLYVSGTTRAQTLEGGECEIRIQDGKFEYLVYGQGGDGSLAAGKVSTRWVITEGHDLDLEAEDALWIDNDGDSEDCNFNSETIEDSFVEEVLDGDRIDVEAFLERLMDGKAVLKRLGEEG